MLLVAAALAAFTASTAKAQASSGEDVVVLHDGSRFRGTLAEHVPGSHATLLLITGEVRRFEEADIAYAGSLASEPGPTQDDVEERPAEPEAPAEPDVGPGELRLRIRSTPGRCEVSLIDSEREVDTRPSCTAPCTLGVLPGRYRFRARDVGGDSSVFLDYDLRLDAPLDLEVRYMDRSGGRIAGTILLVLGLVGATAGLIPLAIGVDEGQDDLTTVGGIVAGISGGVLIGGIVTLAASSPRTDLVVEPGE